MSEISRYTKENMIKALIGLQDFFEVARLVNVGMTHQLELNEAKDDLIEVDYNCYAVWNKEHRCECCVSALAYKAKDKKTKFEFVNNEVYYVVSKYVEVDSSPFMLELVTKIDDSSLFGAYGISDFTKTITGYNEKLYVDPLTKAFNRNYYENQLLGLTRVKAAAMMDIDHFKEVNDTYGHKAGDLVLFKVIDTIHKSIDSSDSIIRYGGDEFIILFENLEKDELESKLNTLRDRVFNLEFPQYPGLKTSISIGGAFCDSCDESVIKSVDKLLYKAKESRNTVCIM